MTRMKFAVIISLSTLIQVTTAFPSSNVTHDTEEYDTEHNREKRDMKTDLDTLGIKLMDDAYKTAHSECMALPSCAVILAKADKDLEKIVRGAAAEKTVQEWFETAATTNDIQKLETPEITKKINAFLNSQTKYIELLKRHESNPVLNVVGKQVDIVKESFKQLDAMILKVMKRFHMTLLPDEANFYRRMNEWALAFRDPAAKLAEYFEAADQYMRLDVGFEKEDYEKAKGAYFTMLNMFTAWTKQKDEPKVCDLLLPSSNRSRIIQVTLVLYNSMLISARNAILIGKITDQDDLCEFKKDLQGCLKEVRKEIKRCVSATSQSKKATTKTNLPDEDPLIEGEEPLEFEGKESWLEIEKNLTKLNNNTEEGDLVRSYGRNLATCANDDSCKGLLQWSDKATNAQRIGSGLESGSTIADEIKGIFSGEKKINGKVLKKIVKYMGPFLGALGPVAAIVGTFSNSPEVQLLNQVIGTINKGFERIENKLDVVENRLNEIKHLIDETQFKDEIRKERDKLVILTNYVDQILYRPPKDIKVLKQLVENLKNEAIIKERTAKAYDALVILHHMFAGKMPDRNTSPSWCESARGFFREHRNKVMTLSMEYFNLWLLGAQKYIFTLKLRGDPTTDYKTNELKKMAEEILTEIGECEDTMINKRWKTQWKTDVQDWAKESGTNGPARIIANTIYKEVTQKYYWRDWLVVVYHTEKGTGKMEEKRCGASDDNYKSRLVNTCSSTKSISQYAYYNVDWRGKGTWIIHVVSVDGGKPKVDLPELTDMMVGEVREYSIVDITCVYPLPDPNLYRHKWFYFDAEASPTIYRKRFPSVVRKGQCKEYVSSGVVRSSDFAVRAPAHRHQKYYQGGEGGFCVEAFDINRCWDGPEIGAWYFG